MTDQEEVIRHELAMELDECRRQNMRLWKSHRWALTINLLLIASAIIYGVSKSEWILVAVASAAWIGIGFRGIRSLVVNSTYDA